MHRSRKKIISKMNINVATATTTPIANIVNKTMNV